MRRYDMLSEHEREIWDDIERTHRTPADEGARGRTGARDRLPAAVVGGGWSAVFLILFGVPSAGLAIGAATAVVWLLWRFLPWPDDADDADGAAAEPATVVLDDRPDAADLQLVQ